MNEVGSFHCECDTGYTLSGNGITCEGKFNYFYVLNDIKCQIMMNVIWMLLVVIRHVSILMVAIIASVKLATT